MAKQTKRVTAKKNYKTKPATRIAVVTQHRSFLSRFGKLVAAFASFARPVAVRRGKRARA
jgi:hypothetical protein